MGSMDESRNARQFWGQGWSLGICVLALLLGACRVEPLETEEPTSIPVPSPTLAPQLLAVPTFTPTPVIQIAEQTPRGTPTPTPTPQSYIVASGDTLIDIGLALGVDPADLQEANDITDPRSLQVGQVLTVPASESQEPPYPPPLAHRAQGLRAYVDGLGFPWLLGEIVNLSSEVVEQVRVEVLLLDKAQNPVANSQGLSFRYLTPPQESSPFMVALEAEQGSWNSWLLVVTSSQKAFAGRLYADLEVSGLSFSQTSEHEVEVRGQIRNAGTGTTQEAEVVLTLYSQTGTVIGVRIVEADNQSLNPGETASFQETVLTVGEPAARVVAVGQGVTAG